MTFFKDKHVLVIITGSIAAYKSAILVRTLIKNQAQVRVAMTESAEKFITALTFSTLTKYPVLTDIFKETDGEVAHVAWARWADFIFVVPATANFIAKIAYGLANDAASALILASSAVKIVAPAMNDQMWHNAATRRNLKQIQADGLLVIDPVVGFLAEGYDAKGHLPDVDDILDQAQVRLLAKHGQLANKKILITAGGTREALDPLRYISNRSSGKMGYALAQAAVEAGASVTLISTVELKVPFNVQLIQVTSSDDMMAAVSDHFQTADVFISAAAVSDFRPSQQQTQKIKKTGNEGLTLNLVQNPDILATVAATKKNQFVVGFAAETQDLLNYAKDKLVKKHADMIIANDVSQKGIGFNADDNQVTIIRPHERPRTLPVQSKLETARSIVTEIAKELADQLQNDFN